METYTKWRLRMIMCMAVVCSTGIVTAEGKSAQACLNKIKRNVALECDTGIIQIRRVLVGYSSDGSCLVDSCPFNHTSVAKTDDYFRNLSSLCDNRQMCVLSSNFTLRFSFTPHCDEGVNQARNTVNVTYGCTAEAPSTSSITNAATTTTTSDLLTNANAVATTPNLLTTAVIPHSSSEQPRAQREDTGADDDLTVKIVAPILGALTVAAMVVLVICLKKKRVNYSSTRRRKSENEAIPDNYEEVTASPSHDNDDTYYSEPKVSGSHSALRLQNVENAMVNTGYQQGPSAAGKLKLKAKSNQQTNLSRQQNESPTDDGFYDTVSDENEYSLADPVTTDTYAVIKKASPREVTPSAKEPINDHSHTKDSDVDPDIKQRSSQANIYHLLEPRTSALCTVPPGAALIRNDLYEYTEPHSIRVALDIRKPVGDEITEFVDNDLYNIEAPDDQV